MHDVSIKISPVTDIDFETIIHALNYVCMNLFLSTPKQTRSGRRRNGLTVEVPLEVIINLVKCTLD